MKLKIGEQAPQFRTQDVYGNELDLNKLRGQKIYLAFERNAGCPVCNLRTHNLLRRADFFAANNIKVVMIYESAAETMRSYLHGTSYPFQFVSDPGNRLYNQYGVQRSMLKVMRSMANGIMSKVKQGTKLFREPMKQDGHLDRIPAEFIIDTNGKLTAVHYGRFVGDHLPIERITISLQ